MATVNDRACCRLTFSSTPMDALPFEILAQMLSFLPRRHRSSARAVCKRWLRAWWHQKGSLRLDGTVVCGHYTWPERLENCTKYLEHFQLAQEVRRLRLVLPHPESSREEDEAVAPAD